MSESYRKLAAYGYKTATLASIGALVNWDQETYMPRGAAPFRAEQSGLLAGLIHERGTSRELGDLIEAAESDSSIEPGSPEAASVREFRRDYDLATKLPGELVEELARVGSQSQEAWKEARQKNDFPAFRPWLEKMIGLTRRKAECYGTPAPRNGAPGEAYDALLNEYEPEARASEIEAVFTPLRDKLGGLLAELDTGSHPGTEPTRIEVPADRQDAFGRLILESMGFELANGRLDVTTHPFCTDMGPRDVRLTTRYREQRFTDALYGTMHEMGHGLYEQGLPKDERFGTPLGEPISLGIHESQSRLWENFVGRSRAFWRWALPHAKECLAPGLEPVDVEQMYAAVNTATPTLVRVEADEATYNMHVMIRFEIERALFSGDLNAGDVPGVWNEKYREYLGLEVPDDARGCMQDVHWSFGLLGYFPTYTLGNLYAAQFWDKINEDIPSLDEDMARGEFSGLLGWLRERIHAHGRRYRADELCERVTGRPVESGPLLRHLESRLKPVYGV